MQLTDVEFRALLQLWVYVAKFGHDGEFERSWVPNVVYFTRGRRRRVCRNACRTCATTNLIALAIAGISAVGLAVASFSKRIVRTA